MAHQVWVRPFNEKDEAERKLLVEWLYAGRAGNRFDPRLFEQKQVMIFTCFNETGVVGFVPIALAYVVESLAFRPGLPAVTEAKALEAMQHMLVCRAIEKNIPYAYFTVSDDSVPEFAQHYGWQKAGSPMMVLNFADLEAKHESDDKPQS